MFGQKIDEEKLKTKNETLDAEMNRKKQTPTPREPIFTKDNILNVTGNLINITGQMAMLIAMVGLGFLALKYFMAVTGLGIFASTSILSIGGIMATVASTFLIITPWNFQLQ